MTEPFDKILDSASASLAETISELCKYVFKTDSPIEEVMAKALIAYHVTSLQSGLPSQLKFAGSENAHCEWFIGTQVEIGKFRVDFVVACSATRKRIIIECDGHDFHERTKEQAEKDRSRDRELAAMGYSVLRFTGSEIWREPWSCAAQVDRQFKQIFNEVTAE